MPGIKEIRLEKQKCLFFSTILVKKEKCRSAPIGMEVRLLRTFGQAVHISGSPILMWHSIYYNYKVLTRRSVRKIPMARKDGQRTLSGLDRLSQRRVHSDKYLNI